MADGRLVRILFSVLLCMVFLAVPVRMVSADVEAGAVWPSISTVVPGSGHRGDTLSVTITGNNFKSSKGSGYVSFIDSGININTYTSWTNTSITVNITINAGAYDGWHTVLVKNSDYRMDSKLQAFYVFPKPEIDEVYPRCGMQGETLTVDIDGHNFGGASAVIFSGGDITVAPGFVISSDNKSIRADITIAGSAMVGYRDVTVTTPDGTDKQRYAFFVYQTPSCGWGAEIADNLSEDVGSYPSIALYGGNPRISYYDEDNKVLKYASRNSSGLWTTETVPNDDTAVGDNAGHRDNYGLYTSLALDGSGKPRISYYDAEHQTLKYASWGGSAWVIETVPNHTEVSGVGGHDDNYGLYTSLALWSGKPRISYYDKHNQVLKYASDNGTAWVVVTVPSETGSSIDLVTDGAPQDNYGLSTSLALDGSGNPHISYKDALNSVPKYASRDSIGSIWVIQIVPNRETPLAPGSTSYGYSYGQYTSLDLDDCGNPHIAYSGDTCVNCDEPELIYAFIRVPTVTGVTPDDGLQGATVSVTIKGTNFINPSKVTFSNSGVALVAGTVIVVNHTTITADITISGTAPTGPGQVYVTTCAGISCPTAGVFTVNAPPSPPPPPPSAPLVGTGTLPGSSGGGVPGTYGYSPPATLPNIVVQSASLSDRTITPGTPVTVTADVTNKGTVNGSKKVTIYVNGQVDTTQGVTVNSGSSSKLTFNVSRSEPGDYMVYVDGVPAGSFKVELFRESDGILIFSVTMLALAFMVGMVMLWRRQRGSQY